MIDWFETISRYGFFKWQCDFGPICHHIQSGQSYVLDQILDGSQGVKAWLLWWQKYQTIWSSMGFSPFYPPILHLKISSNELKITKSGYLDHFAPHLSWTLEGIFDMEKSSKSLKWPKDIHVVSHQIRYEAEFVGLYVDCYSTNGTIRWH